MKSTCLLALTVVAIAASTGLSQTQVPIVNGTFNADYAPAGSYTGISGAAGTSTLTGWNVSAGNRIIDLQHPSPNNTTPVAGQDATQFLEDFYYSPQGWTGATNINQVLTTSFATGYTYLLTVDATVLTAPPSNHESGDTFFIANSSGTMLASTAITGITNGVWTEFTVLFTSTGLYGDTGAIEIGFASPDGQVAGTYDFMEIDNFSLLAVPPVPEPGSSTAIAALGGFCLLGALYRRRWASKSLNG